ncbi:MAG TPA: NAD(P)H-dependent oxidoreductase [Steroidobacteraceae bacterium]|jgi:multimeric flavodoxin WrbA
MTAEVRKGQGSTHLSKEEFSSRLKERFCDPVFESLGAEIDRIVDSAWEVYDQYHKSPRKQPAGAGFADPTFELPIEWLATRAHIIEAQRQQQDPGSRSRVLLICASARSDETCPGELSKTFRLVTAARGVLEAADNQVDFLDLSHLTSAYGRQILPCKACVSTAMPLCHWPCSCYPNHAMGQVNDWMNELYPRFAAAHGLMIVTPVYWYQAPSVLKLLMDRLVCADGGNPDPTTTKGKRAALAKELELKGWSYPRHLAGRAFAVVVHGDAAGVGTLRRSLSDWLTDLHMTPSGRLSQVDRYIGYYGPYATSHDALDADQAIVIEAQNAARSLSQQIRMNREGIKQADTGLQDPRPK